MMKLTSLIVVSAASLLMTLPAQAADKRHPPISKPDEMMLDYDVETMIPLLQELGFPWEGRTAPGGAKVILSEADNGIKFVLAPAACIRSEDDGCYGVNMIAIFAGEADQRTVQAFNYKYPYTSAGIDNGGSAFISRYDIADYGMPRGNFARSLDVFLSQAAYFQDTLSSATKTYSQAAFSDDFAANGLNLKPVLEDEALANRLGIDTTGHEVSLEKTAEFVSVLFKAGEQVPEKIINNVANKQR